MFRSAALRTTSPLALTLARPTSYAQRAFISSSSVLREQAVQEDIRSRLKTALKTAMKAKEKDTTGVIKVGLASFNPDLARAEVLTFLFPYLVHSSTLWIPDNFWNGPRYRP